MANDHPALAETAHRPWPLPDRPWRWRQSWQQLVFLHWEIPADCIRPLIPPGLELDTFDGAAWIGLVPFDMKGVTLRGFPSLAAVSNFPEINVRTYVTVEGKPGVWFFSLDVPDRLAVWIARRFFHLPYHRGAVSIRREREGVHYEAQQPNRRFSARYRSIGEPVSELSAFGRWATERYCLYSCDPKGRVFRGEIHHRQWPLEWATIDLQENTYLEPYPVGPQHPEILYSESIDVVIWPLQQVP